MIHTYQFFDYFFYSLMLFGIIVLMGLLSRFDAITKFFLKIASLRMMIGKIQFSFCLFLMIIAGIILSLLLMEQHKQQRVPVTEALEAKFNRLKAKWQLESYIYKTLIVFAVWLSIYKFCHIRQANLQMEKLIEMRIPDDPTLVEKKADNKLLSEKLANDTLPESPVVRERLVEKRAEREQELLD